MIMTNESLARTRVTAIVQANPRQTAAAIGQQAGVSRQRAHQILSQLGYELVVSWRKRRKAKT